MQAISVVAAWSSILIAGPNSEMESGMVIARRCLDNIFINVGENVGAAISAGQARDQITASGESCVTVCPQHAEEGRRASESVGSGDENGRK
jgi:hypothetical protein